MSSVTIQVGTEFHRGRAHVKITGKLPKKWMVRVTRENIHLDIKVTDKQILELLDCYSTDDVIHKVVNIYTKETNDAH